MPLIWGIGAKHAARKRYIEQIRVQQKQYIQEYRDQITVWCGVLYVAEKTRRRVAGESLTHVYGWVCEQCRRIQMESGLPVWVPANGKMLEAAKRVPLDVQATFESMFKASAKTSVAIINELGEESRLRNSETLDLATALDKVSLLSGELGRYIQQCNNAREAADADAIAADTGSEETFDAEVE